MDTLIDRLKDNARKFSAYRRTVREIESMPADVADDLGITRYDARRIAREVVYG
jgi:uncharacterized protein YjiS (DUF1127 family)